MKNVNNGQEVEQNKGKLERMGHQFLGTTEFGNHGSTVTHSFICSFFNFFL